nr:Cytochrome c synthesis protein A [Thrixspermum amplexicaule]
MKVFFLEQYGLMKHGVHIGIGTLRKLGHLLLGPIFAIYLHTRKNPKLQDQVTNSAFVASIGFLLIWICYFGINLLGIGFHSYGSFQ